MDEIKQRGRPAGHKNVIYGIRLGDLSKLFKEDTLIPTNKTFAKTVKLINSGVDITEMPQSDITEKDGSGKIEFKIIK